MVEETQMLPEQARYIQKELSSDQDWRLRSLLRIPVGLTEVDVRRALEQLVSRHQSLRLSIDISEDPNSRRLVIGDAVDAPLTRADIPWDPEGDQLKVIQGIQRDLESEMSLADSHPIRAVYVSHSKDHSSLLLVIQHFVCDGVSYQIVVNELLSILEGKSPLRPRGTDIQQVSAHLSKLATDGKLDEDIPRWLAIASGDDDLGQTGSYLKHNTNQSFNRVVKSIPGASVRTLWHALRRHSLNVNTAILYGVFRALQAMRGVESIAVNCVGHGRLGAVRPLNAIRTVGWLSTLYPIHLGIRNGASHLDILTMVATKVSLIPCHGDSYGILRYMNKKDAIVEILEGLPSPLIVVNYLGSKPGGNSYMPLERAKGGSPNEKMAPRDHLYDIVIIKADNDLIVSWGYSDDCDSSENIERASEVLITSIMEVPDLLE